MAHEKKVRAESDDCSLASFIDLQQNKLSHRYQALFRFQEWLSQDYNRLKYLGDAP